MAFNEASCKEGVQDVFRMCVGEKPRDALKREIESLKFQAVSLRTTITKQDVTIQTLKGEIQRLEVELATVRAFNEGAPPAYDFVDSPVGDGGGDPDPKRD